MGIRRPHAGLSRSGAALWPPAGRLGRLVGMGYLIGTDEAGYGLLGARP